MTPEPLHTLDFEGFCKPYYGFRTFFSLVSYFNQGIRHDQSFGLGKITGHSVNNELEMARLEAGRLV